MTVPDRPALQRLAAMKNLAEKSAGMLLEVGIGSPEALRQVGAAAAFLRLRRRFRGVSSVFLYALHGALEDAAFTEFPPSLRARMRAEVALRDLALRTSTHPPADRRTSGGPSSG